MAHSRETYKPSLIPQKVGVYVFRDSFGKIIYVGKAKNLRKRLANYFRPSRLKTADVKLRSLIKSINQFEFFEVKTESEALLLESRFIKSYTPQYNILMRDDKRFLMIRINLKEVFPRLVLTRLKKDDGAIYFGPFPQTQTLKKMMDYLNIYFNLRSCSPSTPTVEDKKHCHKHTIKHCSAPCDKSINEEIYRQKVNELLEVLGGNVAGLVDELKKGMQAYATKQQFEKAAFNRDIIENLNFLFKNQRRFTYSKIKSVDEVGILERLQKDLDLDSVPFIIEAFDNSHFQGQNTVSSFVRFVNGKPHSQSYRHYKIKTVDKVDDFASMYEVVYRHYKRVLKEKRSFPNLILIDGGKGQLSSARAALEELGLGQLNILGLAKRNEEIFLPNKSEPILLLRGSISLKILQYLRDEAHRFAITFHRHLRHKLITNSILDDVPRIGEKRKIDLLAAFGSVKNLRRANVDDIIKKVAGINEILATEIYNYLKKN